jgi:hypothetical protein
MPIGQHVRLRLEDDRVIAPTTAARRLLARIILHHGRGFGLLSFGCPDTHLHLETACSHAEAVELDRRIKIHLRKLLHPEVGFQRSRIDAVKDQWHLFNTFKYAITQQDRHGCHVDPFYEATILPDLLGLRVTGDYVIARVSELLPRANRELLLSWADFPPLDDGKLCLDPLVDTAASAVALPDLVGRSSDVVRARRAAVQVACRHARLGEIADLLEIGLRTVKRLKAEPEDGRLIRAIEAQLRLRNAILPARPSLPEALVPAALIEERGGSNGYAVAARR